jgi:hypothetical protein
MGLIWKVRPQAGSYSTWLAGFWELSQLVMTRYDALSAMSEDIRR